MKRFLIVLLFLPTMLYANSSLFCIGGVRFMTKPLSGVAGLKCTVTVSFAVENLKPVNIKISDTCPILTPATEENLRRLIFLRDTTSATIHFHYAYVARGSINTDYAVVKSDSELSLTFRVEWLEKTYLGGLRRVVEGGDTTIVWRGFLGSPSRVPINSEVLVERQFRGNHDTTIILQNKFPELTGAVLEAAKRYRWQDFVPVDRPNESPPEPREVPHKRFLVKFRILHRIPECGVE